VLGVVLASVACSNGEGTEPPGPPAQVLKSGGDNQAWYFNNPLPIPYEVRVTDAASRGVPGVAVAWAVIAGGGSLSAAQTTTAANGIATTVRTLGPSEPVQTVTATVASLPPVTFTADAAAPPPPRPA
jgi:hypothetical protein